MIRIITTALAAATPNAEVDYIDNAGSIVATDRFYDPGLDENSPLAKEQKVRGQWRGPHLAYGCGRKLLAAATVAIGLAAGLTACATAQVEKAQSYHEKIAAACRIAMMVGTLTPVGPWIIGGCSTEAAIAKLALDPNSLNWVQGLIRDAKAG